MRATLLCAFRSLVMLGSLVVLPLLAAVGLPLPAKVVSLLPESVRPLLTSQPTAATPNVHAPLFDLPEGDVRYRVEVPQDQEVPKPFPVGVAAQISLPENRETTLPGGESTPTATPPATMSAPVLLTSGSADLVQGSPTAIPAPIQSPEGRREAIERRLRDLGATESSLAPWGGTGGLFRYQARVAIGADRRLTRHFEAVDREPLAAMEKVLSQVDAWKSGS